MSGPWPKETRPQRGFTLVEVLVALVIVALGMGTVLAALSSAAGNITMLRAKSLAEWIALNRIAEVRLALTPPPIGTSECNVLNFGSGNWHWQERVEPVQGLPIPGLLQITVRVARGTVNAFSSGGTGSGPCTDAQSGAAPAPASTPDPPGPGSQGPQSSKGSRGSRTASNDWIATVVGFRGKDIATASGEVPDWTGANFAAPSGHGSTVGGAQGSNGASGGTGQPRAVTGR